jgi:hypothetical protein
MSKPEVSLDPGGAGDDLSPIESRLGQVLALIHRVLPRLDEPGRATEVQTALRRAAMLIDSARQAHQDQVAPSVPDGPHRVATAVEPEIAAVIAAAVGVVF